VSGRRSYTVDSKRKFKPVERLSGSGTTTWESPNCVTDVYIGLRVVS